MTAQDDRLVRLAQRMSKMPGNASWAEKAARIAGRALTPEEEQYVNHAEAIWRFRQEKTDTAKEQATSSQATMWPLAILLISSSVGAYLKKWSASGVLCGIIMVLAVVALVWWYCRRQVCHYKRQMQIENNRFDSLANLSNTRRLPWEEQ